MKTKKEKINTDLLYLKDHIVGLVTLVKITNQYYLTIFSSFDRFTNKF